MNCRTSRQALETFDDHDSLKNGLEQTLEAAFKYIQGGSEKTDTPKSH